MHDEGGCLTLELVYCVKLSALASQPLDVDAPVSVFSCTDEFHQRRSHDSDESEKTSLCLQRSEQQSAQHSCNTSAMLQSAGM